MKGEKNGFCESYLTTREVAQYLRINEKKVYALVAQNQLPAARIGGKWLFPRKVIDSWIEKNTLMPPSGIMGALLGELLVIQGSNDWLLDRLLESLQERLGQPIATSSSGSLAGVEALWGGLAHVAGFHVDPHLLKSVLGEGSSWYRLNLFNRTQGIVCAQDRSDLFRDGLDAAKCLRMATRQEKSGTYALASRLLENAGVLPESLGESIQYRSHLEVALAVMRREVDFGFGIEVVARQLSLGFLPLEQESYQLLVNAEYLTHPKMQRFLDVLLDELDRVAVDAPAGYSFSGRGSLELFRVIRP